MLTECLIRLQCRLILDANPIGIGVCICIGDSICGGTDATGIFGEDGTIRFKFGKDGGILCCIGIGESVEDDPLVVMEWFMMHEFIGCGCRCGCICFGCTCIMVVDCGDGPCGGCVTCDGRGFGLKHVERGICCVCDCVCVNVFLIALKDAFVCVHV